MTKKKSRRGRVTVCVVARAGADLPGYGHRSYGEKFELSRELAEVLVQASPQIFSLDDPLATHELKEVNDVV